jgi:hypothetical protein
MSEDSLIRAEIQKTLTDLLRIDSHLAFTFLQTADLDLDPRHSYIAVEKARVALASVRRLVVRIEDPAVRAEINSRADELELKLNHYGM